MRRLTPEGKIVYCIQNGTGKRTDGFGNGKRGGEGDAHHETSRHAGQARAVPQRTDRRGECVPERALSRQQAGDSSAGQRGHSRLHLGKNRSPGEPPPSTARRARPIPPRRPGVFFYLSTTVARRIVTASVGTSWNIETRPVGTARILSTTSIPSITFPNTAYPNPRGVPSTWFKKSLVTTLMKNCAVAESTTPVRAIAIVPRSFLSPLPASFLMGGWAGRFSRISLVKPPPWIMKSRITR